MFTEEKSPLEMSRSLTSVVDNVVVSKDPAAEISVSSKASSSADTDQENSRAKETSVVVSDDDLLSLQEALQMDPETDAAAPETPTPQKNTNS